MTHHTLLVTVGWLALTPALYSQDLDHAEVRLPYAELKELLARTVPPAKPATPKPALLGIRLKLSLDGDRPAIDATFRTTSFTDELALLPLLGGDVALESQEPANVSLVADGDNLCLATEAAGMRTLQLRLLPVVRKNRFALTLPACPSVIFETGKMGADQSLVLSTTAGEETLGGGQVRPLPHTSQELSIRLLDSRETREALRPPEPSIWTWQNQTLVIPGEGELIYQTVASASAANGSGVEAMLPLPADARDVTVTGEDLTSQTKVRGENRELAIQLGWQTRGILDRQINLTYRLPLRPLDREWHLQAPGAEGTRTRFIIATSSLHAYAADGLTGPLAAQGLPAVLAQALQGGASQHLEAGTSADLTVTPLPVAATAEGVVTRAEWVLKVEPDGAMLATGTLTIEHKSQLGFVLDTPQGMKLLACEVGGKAVTPVDLGKGTLQVMLTPQTGGSRLTCSFTGRTEQLDPVEGTLALALPKTPLFMHALVWQLDLPAGYQAETHGNLTRRQTEAGAPPSRITLSKNLCRDERPEIQVFYQRSDLKL